MKTNSLPLSAERGPDDDRRTIVLIESAAAMGGVQFSTLYLAQKLDPKSWKPIVVCPEEGDLTRACRNAGVETFVADSSRLWSTSVRLGKSARLPNPFAWIRNALVVRRAVRNLRLFLKQCSPDLVVTKGLSSHFVGGLAVRSLRIPCVWHVQDLISERSLGIYRRIFSLAARYLPARIIVDGSAIAKQLPSSLSPRISVVHNGVDTNVFRPGLDSAGVRAEFGIRKDELVIGHAGRITPWKGQHYLIEAFARIAQQHPHVTLLFAGSPVFDNDAYQNRLRAMTADSGLQDRIKFAGYRHDLPEVLAAMDIFAFTSIEKDTSPLALLSAMSAGLPIVAFDIAGVRELLDADEQLLRVPVGDIEALASSLESLISNDAFRSRLGRSVRQLAEKKYSLPRYVEEVERVLLSIETVRATEVHPEVADENVRSLRSSAKPSAASAVKIDKSGFAPNA